MTTPQQIPPLRSGGLMLTYHCTNTCAHCLYRCSSNMPNYWIDEDTAEKALHLLSEEPEFTGLHLAGGEATEHIELLLTIIKMTKQKNIPLDYLETNANWCVNESDTFDIFSELKDAGLDAVLISASFFHNEFIPFMHTRTGIEQATKIFGESNVIVWTPNIYEMLCEMPNPERTHTLRETCEHFKIDPNSQELLALHNYLTPSGRAVERLSKNYGEKPADAFKGDACANTLMDTSHFHIDPFGNIFTGLCPGIAPATVDDPHPDITRENTPITWTLCEEGPFGLISIAEEKGFELNEGYASKCDLCFAIRKHLREKDTAGELSPAVFYR